MLLPQDCGTHTKSESTATLTGCTSKDLLITQSILITGATSGIGEALAVAYAKPGTTLAITGRNAAALSRVVSACEAQGATVRFKAVDVNDSDVLGAWIREIDASVPLDLVIANAGVTASTLGRYTSKTSDLEAAARASEQRYLQLAQSRIYPSLL